MVSHRSIVVAAFLGVNVQPTAGEPIRSAEHLFAVDAPVAPVTNEVQGTIGRIYHYSQDSRTIAITRIDFPNVSHRRAKTDHFERLVRGFRGTREVTREKTNLQRIEDVPVLDWRAQCESQWYYARAINYRRFTLVLAIRVTTPDRAWAQHVISSFRPAL